MSRARALPHPGQCRRCERRRGVYSCSRKGAGSYNRGQRSYRSSLCAECALDLLPYYQPGSLSVSSWDGMGVERIVASLGTLEAAEVLGAYRERRDRRAWARESRVQ
jgi:hypothetical protein